jgi:hypothetical protein
MICRNYILIIIFKMASLLAVMNRAITYFKESKSATGVTGVTGEASVTSETNNEVSTDDGSSISVDRMSIDEIIPCDDAPLYLCIMCEYTVPIDKYIAVTATNSQGHGTQLSVIMCDIAVIHSTYSYCFIELLIISILNV